jgi:hypothetical protein
MSRVASTLAMGLLLGTASAAPPAWRADLGLTVSRFEQQVKTEVGGARGERLVEETALSAAAFGTWRAWGPLEIGLFTQYDVGVREAGRFSRFDAQNKAIVEPAVGGTYQELWVGPLVRASWRGAFAEVGWGAVGLRWDDGRTDLPDADGDTDAALRTRPSIAWLLGLGYAVPLSERWSLALRLSYRVRYYDRRGAPLAQDVAHGTQSLTPLIGVAWSR